MTDQKIVHMGFIVHSKSDYDILKIYDNKETQKIATLIAHLHDWLDTHTHTIPQTSKCAVVKMITTSGCRAKF